MGFFFAAFSLVLSVSPLAEDVAFPAHRDVGQHWDVMGAAQFPDGPRTTLIAGTAEPNNQPVFSPAVSAMEDHKDLPAARTVFPLRVVPGNHYLVDGNGKPFLLIGDNAWSIAGRLQPQEIDQYLDDRRARGFDSIMFDIDHGTVDNPPYNLYGEAPFSSTIGNANGSACPIASGQSDELYAKLAGKIKALLRKGNCWDFSKPNETYWRNLDLVVQKATTKGFLLLIAPAYLGYGGKVEGWYQDMVANGPTILYDYGAFVANRYKNNNNILWVEGGDFVPPPSGMPLVAAVANGIRSVMPDSLQTGYPSRELAAREYWAQEPWFSVNAIYSRWTPYHLAKAQFATSEMPFFLVESYYEGASGANNARIRSETYQTFLTGGFGYVMGNEALWPLQKGWQQALDSPGAQGMTHLHDLFASHAWWLLRPDSGALTVAGQSTEEHFAPAAIAADKSFAFVYLPAGEPLGLDMQSLAGPHVMARWYDPGSGAYTAVAGSPFNNVGVQTFQPPRNNADGYRDWVLVLESQS